MKEITLTGIYEIIKKNIKLIILFTAVATILAALITTQMIEPMYKASTTLMVGKPREFVNGENSNIEYNDIMVNQKLVATYGEIIKTRTIAEQVIANLQLKFSPGELVGRIYVQPVTNTEIMKIVVTDTIPRRAADIANETALIFQDQIQTIMKIDNVTILDKALVPSSPSSPNVRQNIMVGSAFGMMLGLLVALLREFFDRTVKSAEQIEKALGVPVLANVPELVKNEKSANNNDKEVV